MRAQPNSASLARLVAAVRLQGRYNPLEDLKQKTQAEGIPPDDHTLYTELLEWRAINHELTDLLRSASSLRTRGSIFARTDDLTPIVGWSDSQAT